MERPWRGSPGESHRPARRRLRNARAWRAWRPLRVRNASVHHSVGAASLRAGRDQRGRGCRCTRGPCVGVGDGGGTSGRVLVCGALYGRRLRLADLGAGEELRSFEQSRRWAWQPPPARRAGERIYLRSQGELVHKRPWPAGVPYAPMSRVDHDGLRLPLGEGAAHIRVRCDRLGKDDDDAPRSGCADAHAERGAADSRSEGRRGRRAADAPARGRGGGAVRADRSSGRVE